MYIQISCQIWRESHQKSLEKQSKSFVAVADGSFNNIPPKRTSDDGGEGRKEDEAVWKNLD